ncbi:MAG: BatA domain-containing protein [Rubripirellula sp.]|nr:BatA domain-containing protein [Rubripirellula sp.]
MTLLNGLLAFGALAFTVPLAIHLLFRSRFRTLDWGAMHLLDTVVRINRRRIQLLHLLLLLLRCLLPVLLAFCLARPILTGFQALPADAPQSLILAIDDSRSMSARDEAESGISRMSRLQQELTGILNGLSRRDEVILVRASGVETPAAAMGIQEAIRQVRELDTEFGPVDLDQLLRAAIEASNESSHPQRRIIIASDFQSQMVHSGVMDSLSRLTNTLAEMPIRPVISFLNMGIDSEQLSNVSVDAITVDSPAVVGGRNARFTVQVRSSSDTPIRDLRLVWSVDGQPLEPRTVTIPPRSSITSRLTRNIDQVGVHEITVSIEHSDALIADNRRSIAVDVIREVTVMLVDGKPSSKPLEGETDFLAIALSPFAFGGQDQPDAVRTSVVRPQEIVAELEKKVPDVVILANVDRIQDETRKRLSQFVSSGGNLIVFDGDNIDTDSYNARWEADEASWYLPARLGELVGDPENTDAPPLPIGNPNPLYTPWNLLGSDDQQPFSDVEIYGYRKLTPGNTTELNTTELSVLRPTPSASESLASTANDGVGTVTNLLTMANGDPIAISARRGRGRVLQFAIPCDTAWTSLPMRLVYLPMIQQLVLDLAGSRKQTTIDVGNGFTVPINELVADAESAIETDPDKTVSYSVEYAGASEQPIKASNDSGAELLVPSTTVGGTYVFRKTTPVKGGEPVVTSTLRVVEVPADESKLRDVDASRLATAAKLIDANVYTDVSELVDDDRTHRFGREVWRWLLVTLLALMIGELLLQQRASRVGAA